MKVGSTNWSSTQKGTVNSAMPITTSHLPNKVFEQNFESSTRKLEIQNPKVGFLPAKESQTATDLKIESKNQIKTGQKIDILA